MTQSTGVRPTQYLIECCSSTLNVASRQRLHSASQYQLIVPRHRRSTLSRLVFSVACPIDNPPHHLRHPTLSCDSFKKALKTSLEAPRHSVPLRNALYTTTTTTTTTTCNKPLLGKRYMSLCTRNVDVRPKLSGLLINISRMRFFSVTRCITLVYINCQRTECGKK